MKTKSYRQVMNLLKKRHEWVSQKEESILNMDLPTINGEAMEHVSIDRAIYLISTELNKMKFVEEMGVKSRQFKNIWIITFGNLPSDEQLKGNVPSVYYQKMFIEYLRLKSEIISIQVELEELYELRDSYSADAKGLLD